MLPLPALVAKWQTRTLEVRVEKSMGVRVSPSALYLISEIYLTSRFVDRIPGDFGSQECSVALTPGASKSEICSSPNQALGFTGNLKAERFFWNAAGYFFLPAGAVDTAGFFWLLAFFALC